MDQLVRAGVKPPGLVVPSASLTRKWKRVDLVPTSPVTHDASSNVTSPLYNLQRLSGTHCPTPVVESSHVLAILNSFNGLNFTGTGGSDKVLSSHNAGKTFGQRGAGKRFGPGRVHPVSASSRCLFLAASLLSGNM